ncbi:hypothetical protein BH11MYX1_BH11MYX1_06070 [soil metagenome]
MYCSIDKIDLAARVDGKPIAIQTDHRTAAEIDLAPELSVLFAMARILNARAQLADDGHRHAAVHYVLGTKPPEVLREALVATGAKLERSDRKMALEALGLGSVAATGALADRMFAQLAKRAAGNVGVRDLAMALRMLEQQTTTNPPDRSDEVAYWTRVLELAALAGELLRAKYAGRWIQTERALVPFGFEVGTSVVFPTNRAQRVIEDVGAASLFELLAAAREPMPVATGRLMPSLRARAEVSLDEILWRPVVDDEAPKDLPIIVCGIDGEHTFAMLRREALPKPAEQALAEAYANLAEEAVQCDVLPFEDATIIIVSGSFYAAEKLLDRDFMRSLHDDLGADLLAAAAPARGCLLVGKITDEPEAIARFTQLARTRHDQSWGRSISPALMLVSDGRVAGYVRGPGDHDPSAGPATSAPPKPPSFLRRLFGRK